MHAMAAEREASVIASSLLQSVPGPLPESELAHLSSLDLCKYGGVDTSTDSEEKVATVL